MTTVKGVIQKQSHLKNLQKVKIWCTVTSKQISIVPPYGLTVQQVSMWSDQYCKRSYPETKCERTDSKEYTIIPNHYPVVGYKNVNIIQSIRVTWLKNNNKTIRMLSATNALALEGEQQTPGCVDRPKSLSAYRKMMLLTQGNRSTSKGTRLAPV